MPKKTTRKKVQKQFKFKRHENIGSNAAEEDSKYLANCFVDTGDLSTLTDFSSPKCVVLGRTGVGKTALINKLIEETSSEAIVIDPQSLSFNYLSNSTILKVLLESGVSLDSFFKLLWRHVFAVELIKKRYNIKNEEDEKGFFNQLIEKFFGDTKKKKAVEYLKQFGGTFWEETEYRIKEITEKIESEVKANVGVKAEVFEVGGSIGDKLSTEQKTEVVTKAQSVVNNIQIKYLNTMLEFLDEEILNDRQKKYYICIDKLDDNWVDEQFRYLLIRSLIDAVREFRKVKQVKIIVAIRQDLLNRVVRRTRDGGFQEEKYKSLYLEIRWSEFQLKEILDKRVNYLIRESYTKVNVFSEDILPVNITNQPAITYFIERTLMRPRDLIEFFNFCLSRSEGRAAISPQVIQEAESSYSQSRLRSLQDEWFSEFPFLITCTSVLKKKPSQFTISTILQDEVADLASRILDEDPLVLEKNDDFSVTVKEAVNGKFDKFLAQVFRMFYQTSIIGLKAETFEPFAWSHASSPTISADTIETTMSVRVHPMLWRVLGIRPISN